MQEKISTFNKPKENEEEVMKLQRKKASFNSKCAKFESKEPLAKKDSLAKQTVKMFEDFEGMAVSKDMQHGCIRSTSTIKTLLN